MPCIPFNQGGVTGFVCTSRGSIPKCTTCLRAKSATLECDGCDTKLCPQCAVSHRKGADFCPMCCRVLFKEWCATEEGRRYAANLQFSWGRDQRRNAFRAWAKSNPDRFDLLMI